MKNINPKKIVFIPLENDEFFKPIINTIKIIQKDYQLIGRAFIYSLEGLFLTISLPFNITLSSVVNRRFQQFHIAELIRSGEDVPIPTKVEKVALEIANKKLKKELGSKKGINSIKDLTINELKQLINNKDMEPAIGEILRQGTVLTWSAFEVFFKNFITQLLNNKPELIIELVNNSKTSSKFQLKKIDLSKLAEYNFNVSESIGTIFFENINFSNLSTIRDVLGVVFPNNDLLRKYVSESNMWNLNQGRHCVVHNFGNIDSDYINNTVSKAKIGTKLVVTPNELENQLLAIRDTVSELLISVAKLK